MHQPQNLQEMQSVMELYQQLVNDIPRIEENFPAISDQLQTLDKYKVEIKDEVRKKDQNIPVVWTEYLDVLDQANKMINYAKVLLEELGKI